MPTIRSGEKKKDWLKRCIPVLIEEGKSEEQASAICYSMWAEKRKVNSMEPVLKIKGKESVESENIKKTDTEELTRLHTLIHWIWDIKKADVMDVELTDAEVVQIHKAISDEFKNKGLTHVSQLLGVDETILLQSNKEQQEEDGEDLVNYEVKFLKAEDGQEETEEEERMVYGIVLEPNTVDAQRDIISEEEIKLAAHRFLEDSQEIGYEHTDFAKSFKIMESFVAPDNFIINKQQVKKGTWLMAVRVVDDQVWKEVKKGNLKGFSVAGKAIRTKTAA